MRLTRSPRTLAAISFIWPVVVCLGILTIFASFDTFPRDLWVAGYSSRGLLLTLGTVIALAAAFSGLLFSNVPLSTRALYWLLGICATIAVLCLIFAQIVLIVWVFPLLYVFRLTRAPAA